MVVQFVSDDCLIVRIDEAPRLARGWESLGRLQIDSEGSERPRTRASGSFPRQQAQRTERGVTQESRQRDTIVTEPLAVSKFPGDRHFADGLESFPTRLRLQEPRQTGNRRQTNCSEDTGGITHRRSERMELGPRSTARRITAEKWWLIAFSVSSLSWPSSPAVMLSWAICGETLHVFLQCDNVTFWPNTSVRKGLRRAENRKSSPHPLAALAGSRLSLVSETGSKGENRAVSRVVVHDRTLVDSDHGPKRGVQGHHTGLRGSMQGVLLGFGDRGGIDRRLSFCPDPCRRGSRNDAVNLDVTL